MKWLIARFRKPEAKAPDGFARIATLPITTAEEQNDLRICDWRPVPGLEYYGCLFMWLEVEGARRAYFITQEEARHLETGPTAKHTHLRIVQHKGRYYALPVIPQLQKPITVLPPPPAVFPPPASSK